jgi:quinol monooxygenase YgiN
MRHPPFVVFVEWEIPPEHHSAFIKAVADIVESNPNVYKGLLSARFLRSQDGSRVVNCARWKSKQAWEDALEIPGRSEATAKVKSAIRKFGGRSLGTEGFSIERVVGESHDCPG